MNLYFFPSFETYKYTSIVFDGLAAIIMLVVLITLVNIPAKESLRTKWVFSTCLVFGLFTSVCDIMAYICLMDETVRSIFESYSFLDGIFYYCFLMFETSYILTYLDRTKGINKIISIIIQSILGLQVLAMAIPYTSKKILFVVEKESYLATGPWYQGFSIITIVSQAILVALLIINIKKLGVKDFFLLMAMQLIPLGISSFLWDEEPIILLSISILMLVSYIAVYQGRLWKIYEQEKELNEMNNQLLDMQTKIVLSQVQPHFLYNTLSSIAYYCKRDPDVAQKLTLNFSTYLRSNIDSLDADNTISFAKELEHTKIYLEIEKVRFGERLNVEYDINYSEFSIPPLILQPMAENAVKHGVCKKEEGGTVTITTERIDNDVIITVSDDGVGFDTSVKRDDGVSHIGLNSVAERIEKLCHGRIEVESEIGKGTTITMIIPLEAQEEA